ncbi:hypothetical protein AZE42_09319 [Rhizopogon vesiculosus]|uniref:Cytochrome P450 n=1 Tax=Rhizopogon vesiculosus TaxID=180088 RepID=A0A1J8QYM1_9AGAM|nr:hypothetical protein AZE42_09319 [Rhizopogon vesiculosus]
MVDLIGRQNNVGFTYFGDKLRTSRKLLHASLGTAARNEWKPMIEEGCVDVMKLLADKPEYWKTHVKLHVASLVVRFTYGGELTEEYVDMAEEINLDTGMALQPGWIVDSLPLLKYLPDWLPGMHFKRWALAARLRFERCTQEPYDATRLSVLDGTAPPSFVARHLTSILNRSSSSEEEILMHTAGSVYGAGTDTSWVMCNVWSMTHDPEIYDNVEVFNPDRHLSGTVKDPRQFTFGFGRRSCPGIHFANAETFMFIACVLYLFKIGPAGEIPPLSYTPTFTSQPNTFECQFELRDAALKELLYASV